MVFVGGLECGGVLWEDRGGLVWSGMEGREDMCVV